MLLLLDDALKGLEVDFKVESDRNTYLQIFSWYNFVNSAVIRASLVWAGSVINVVWKAFTLPLRKPAFDCVILVLAQKAIDARLHRRG